MKAIGLNFADLFACLELYSATPAGTFVPRLEFAGVVDAFGLAVSAAAKRSELERAFALTLGLE